MNLLKALKNHVDITPGFLLIAAIFAGLAGPERALMALISVSVHESGHLACLALFGGKLEKLRLTAVGAEILCERPLSYLEEFFAALSGPFAGALLAAACLAAGELTGRSFAYELAAVSILYTFFNLLPIGPTDGGRALSAALNMLFSPGLASKLSFASDIVCLLALLGAGIYVFVLSGWNFSLIFCAFFLAEACCKKSWKGVK